MNENEMCVNCQHDHSWLTYPSCGRKCECEDFRRDDTCCNNGKFGEEHKCQKQPERPAPQGTPEKVSECLKCHRKSEIIDLEKRCPFCLAAPTPKDPEPISAQIEGLVKELADLDLLDDNCGNMKYGTLAHFSKIRIALSTAHRNGVEEGKKECVLAMKKYFDEIDEEDWKSWEVSSKLSLLFESLK